MQHGIMPGMPGMMPRCTTTSQMGLEWVGKRTSASGPVIRPVFCPLKPRPFEANKPTSIPAYGYSTGQPEYPVSRCYFEVYRKLAAAAPDSRNPPLQQAGVPGLPGTVVGVTLTLTASKMLSRAAVMIPRDQACQGIAFYTFSYLKRPFY